MTEPALRWLDPALDADVQAWRAVRLEMLQAAPEAFSSRYEDALVFSEEQWRAQVSLPQMATLVASRAGRPVGAARLTSGSEGPPELISMYVAREARGTGLARALVEAVAERAAARGHRCLHLHVVVDNARARSLYERCAFAVVGEPLPVSPEDPLDGRLEVRMERPLHP